ncbi:MAG: hypothetical protein N2690_06950 [Rhodocyclaceae bacterium]|nr:hypothetical protein [Rhodocyclaceae bacterium]
MHHHRLKFWQGEPLAPHLGAVHALMAHAPRFAQDLIEIHCLPPKGRIEKLVAVCALALQDNPALAGRLKAIVPALAQEKLHRSGLDPSQAQVLFAAKQSDAEVS